MNNCEPPQFWSCTCVRAYQELDNMMSKTHMKLLRVNESRTSFDIL
jgi:hypothetical protein